MIEIQESESPDVVEIKVIEQLSSADLEYLEPVLKKHIKESARPRLLMVIREFGGWGSLKAFWEDLKMDTEYINTFDRIALIGDDRWEEWGTKLADSMTASDLKFFSLSDIAAARKWLK